MPIPPKLQRLSVSMIIGSAFFTSLAGCGGGSSLSTSSQTLGGLNTLVTLSSTVDTANGDTNPYGIAIAPPASSFTTAGVYKPGDVLVSNFNNSAGTNGAGTTIEDVMTGQPVRVAQETTSSGPAALAFSVNGAFSVANFGLGTTSNPGDVQEYAQTGVLSSVLTDPSVEYGWGQASNGGYGGKNCFFSVNEYNGDIVRINVTTASNGVSTYTFDQLSGDLGHTMSGFGGGPVGPSALVHDSNDTLYILNSYSNSIMAIPNATTAPVSNNLSNVLLIYYDNSGKYLDQPIGMTLNPINNDLIVANQKSNTLVEINPLNRSIVAVKTVDPTAVNQTTGAGSALFGVAATSDTNGNLVIYYTDDNTNTVMKLSK